MSLFFLACVASACDDLTQSLGALSLNDNPRPRHVRLSIPQRRLSGRLAEVHPGDSDGSGSASGSDSTSWSDSEQSDSVSDEDAEKNNGSDEDAEKIASVNLETPLKLESSEKNVISQSGLRRRFQLATRINFNEENRKKKSVKVKPPLVRAKVALDSIQQKVLSRVKSALSFALTLNPTSSVAKVETKSKKGKSKKFKKARSLHETFEKTFEKPEDIDSKKPPSPSLSTSEARERLSKRAQQRQRQRDREQSEKVLDNQMEKHDDESESGLSSYSAKFFLKIALQYVVIGFFITSALPSELVEVIGARVLGRGATGEFGDVFFDGELIIPEHWIRERWIDWERQLYDSPRTENGDNEIPKHWDQDRWLDWERHLYGSSRTENSAAEGLQRFLFGPDEKSAGARDFVGRLLRDSRVAVKRGIALSDPIHNLFFTEFYLENMFADQRGLEKASEEELKAFQRIFDFRPRLKKVFDAVVKEEEFEKRLDIYHTEQIDGESVDAVTAAVDAKKDLDANLDASVHFGDETFASLFEALSLEAHTPAPPKSLSPHLELGGLLDYAYIPQRQKRDKKEALPQSEKPIDRLSYPLPVPTNPENLPLPLSIPESIGDRAVWALGREMFLSRRTPTGEILVAHELRSGLTKARSVLDLMRKKAKRRRAEAKSSAKKSSDTPEESSSGPKKSTLEEMQLRLFNGLHSKELGILWLCAMPRIPRPAEKAVEPKLHFEMSDRDRLSEDIVSMMEGKFGRVPKAIAVLDADSKVVLYVYRAGPKKLIFRSVVALNGAVEDTVKKAEENAAMSSVSLSQVPADGDVADTKKYLAGEAEAPEDCDLWIPNVIETEHEGAKVLHQNRELRMRTLMRGFQGAVDRLRFSILDLILTEQLEGLGYSRKNFLRIRHRLAKNRSELESAVRRAIPKAFEQIRRHLEVDIAKLRAILFEQKKRRGPNCWMQGISSQKQIEAIDFLTTTVEKRMRELTTSRALQRELGVKLMHEHRLAVQRVCREDRDILGRNLTEMTGEFLAPLAFEAQNNLKTGVSYSGRATAVVAQSTEEAEKVINGVRHHFRAALTRVITNFLSSTESLLVIKIPTQEAGMTSAHWKAIFAQLPASHVAPMIVPSSPDIRPLYSTSRLLWRDYIAQYGDLRSPQNVVSLPPILAYLAVQVQDPMKEAIGRYWANVVRHLESLSGTPISFALRDDEGFPRVALQDAVLERAEGKKPFNSLSSKEEPDWSFTDFFEGGVSEKSLGIVRDKQDLRRLLLEGPDEKAALEGSDDKVFFDYARTAISSTAQTWLAADRPAEALDKKEVLENKKRDAAVQFLTRLDRFRAFVDDLGANINPLRLSPEEVLRSDEDLSRLEHLASEFASLSVIQTKKNSQRLDSRSYHRLRALYADAAGRVTPDAALRKLLQLDEKGRMLFGGDEGLDLKDNQKDCESSSFADVMSSRRLVFSGPFRTATDRKSWRNFHEETLKEVAERLIDVFQRAETRTGLKVDLRNSEAFFGTTENFPGFPDVRADIQRQQGISRQRRQLLEANDFAAIYELALRAELDPDFSGCVSPTYADESFSLLSRSDSNESEKLLSAEQVEDRSFLLGQWYGVLALFDGSEKHGTEDALRDSVAVMQGLRRAGAIAISRSEFFGKQVLPKVALEPLQKGTVVRGRANEKSANVRLWWGNHWVRAPEILIPSALLAWGEENASADGGEENGPEVLFRHPRMLPWKVAYKSRVFSDADLQSPLSEAQKSLLRLARSYANGVLNVDTEVGMTAVLKRALQAAEGREGGTKETDQARSFFVRAAWAAREELLREGSEEDSVEQVKEKVLQFFLRKKESTASPDQESKYSWGILLAPFLLTLFSGVNDCALNLASDSSLGRVLMLEVVPHWLVSDAFEILRREPSDKEIESSSFMDVEELSMGQRDVVISHLWNFQIAFRPVLNHYLAASKKTVRAIEKVPEVTLLVLRATKLTQLSEQFESAAKDWGWKPRAGRAETESPLADDDIMKRTDSPLAMDDDIMQQHTDSLDGAGLFLAISLGPLLPRLAAFARDIFIDSSFPKEGPDANPKPCLPLKLIESALLFLLKSELVDTPSDTKPSLAWTSPDNLFRLLSAAVDIVQDFETRYAPRLAAVFDLSHASNWHLMWPERKATLSPGVSSNPLWTQILSVYFSNLELALQRVTRSVGSALYPGSKVKTKRLLHAWDPQQKLFRKKEQEKKEQEGNGFFRDLQRGRGEVPKGAEGVLASGYAPLTGRAVIELDERVWNLAESASKDKLRLLEEITARMPPPPERVMEEDVYVLANFQFDIEENKSIMISRLVKTDDLEVSNKDPNAEKPSKLKKSFFDPLELLEQARKLHGMESEVMLRRLHRQVTFGSLGYFFGAKVAPNVLRSITAHSVERHFASAEVFPKDMQNLFLNSPLVGLRQRVERHSFSDAEVVKDVQRELSKMVARRWGQWELEMSERRVSQNALENRVKDLARKKKRDGSTVEPVLPSKMESVDRSILGATEAFTHTNGILRRAVLARKAASGV